MGLWACSNEFQICNQMLDIWTNEQNPRALDLESEDWTGLATQSYCSMTSGQLLGTQDCGTPPVYASFPSYNKHTPQCRLSRLLTLLNHKTQHHTHTLHTHTTDRYMSHTCQTQTYTIYALHTTQCACHSLFILYMAWYIHFGTASMYKHLLKEMCISL